MFTWRIAQGILIIYCRTVMVLFITFYGVFSVEKPNTKADIHSHYIPAGRFRLKFQVNHIL